MKAMSTLCRAVAVLAGAALLGGPDAASAQAAVKRARVAILSPFAPLEPGVETFRNELTRLGWIEGQNLDLQMAWVHGRLERLPAAAAELAARNPDVVFAPGEQGLAAVKQAAPETPIVTVACDPLDRLIVSLSAPGGSATGLSCVSSELAGKRLEMLKELVPGIARAAVIYNGTDQNKGLEFKQLGSAGARLGITVQSYAVAKDDELADAFARIASTQNQAVLVLADAFTIFHRQKLAELALERKLPSVFGFKEFAEAGGLLSYGASRRVLFGRAAAYVDKILKGAKAGELPVEEPTVFELYINRKTANALGLTIPPTLLARADEVIE